MEDDHWPPSSAEVKNEWHYTSTPSYALMACTGTTSPLPLPNKRSTAPLVKLTVVQLIKNYAPLLKPEESLLCSQEPATGSYPEPDQSNHNTAWMNTVSLSMSKQSDKVLDTKHMKYAANRRTWLLL